ncbi:MAG TPA: response regulator [Rickettsiales bacterium]|nr:response regulator [Rickettsiales bacterium]
MTNIEPVATKGRPVEILLVEDNPGDILLTRKAFKSAKIANNITIAEDGNKALAILKREGEYASLPKMDIVFLDLNLPKKSGQAVLEEIKSDENLRSIPVVILTSSKAELDIVKSYNLHANSYVVKPVNLDKFVEIVRSLEDFWFMVATLPEKNTGTEG